MAVEAVIPNEDGGKALTCAEKFSDLFFAYRPSISESHRSRVQTRGRWGVACQRVSRAYFARLVTLQYYVKSPSNHRWDTISSGPHVPWNLPTGYTSQFHPKVVRFLAGGYLRRLTLVGFCS